MGRSSDPEREIRRARVYRLFTEGRSYREIAAALDIDKDTVTSDVRALTSRLDTWASDHKKRAFAFVTSTYQRVIDEAWNAYDDECERERKWLDGAYDREHDAPDVDGGTHKEAKPPPFKVIKVSWLNTIQSAATAYAKLTGVEAAQKLEMTGKDGGAWTVTVIRDETTTRQPARPEGDTGGETEQGATDAGADGQAVA